MNELTRTPETVGAEIRGLTAQAKQMTLWFGIEIGRRLCEVKEMIGHGEWLPYLKAQTEFSQSTASRFMTLYREYGAQQQTLFGAESNYPTLNNLSISNALRLLALPENERESFAEEHDVEHMSARELEELIQEKKAAEDERDLYEQKLAEQMGAAERLKTVPWPRGYPAARCMADGRMRGAVIGRRPTDDCPVYRPAWCPGKEDDVERRI